MTIPPGLAAELDLLTQALDLPDSEVAETLIRLTAAAQSAVDSYLGLSVAITAHRSQFDLTVLQNGVQPAQIETSLLVPLSPALDEGVPVNTSVALILYAAALGAFTDLAADLSWITGRPLADFRIDENRTLPPNVTDPTPFRASSSINQALGVLIGRGLTPEQAERDLHARAVAAGIDVLGAAALILAALSPLRPQLGRP